MKKGDRKSRIKTAGEDEEERMWKNRSFTWMELGILYSPDLKAHRNLFFFIKCRFI